MDALRRLGRKDYGLRESEGVSMSEYVYLVGAEQVQSAGHAMSGAASEMRHAASLISDTMYQQQQFMQQWLDEFRVVLEDARAGKQESK